MLMTKTEQTMMDEGYDVPWEYMRRRGAKSASPKPAPSIARLQQQLQLCQKETSAIGAASDENLKRTAIIAPKVRHSDSDCSAKSSSPPVVSVKADLGGGGSTPTCGLRAQRIRNSTRTASAGASVNEFDAKNTAVWVYRRPEDDARPLSEYDAPWDNNGAGANVSIRALMSAAESNNRLNGCSTTDSRQRETDVYDEPWDRKPELRLQKTPSSTEIMPAKSRSSTEHRGDDQQQSSSKSSSPVVKMETAFCAKNVRGGSSSASATSKNRSQDRDRLIQQLWSAGALTRDDQKNFVVNNVRAILQSKPSASNSPVPAERSCRVGSSLPTAKRSETKVQYSSKTSEEPSAEYDVPWEFLNGAKTNPSDKDVHSAPSPKSSQEPAATSNIALLKSKLNRQHLALNFGCAALNPASAKINAELPLNEQLWYHGNITRAEAEQRLSKTGEGSFLVRCCESSTRSDVEYALSLKSAKGFMHMKIQQDCASRWILGYFSQPFDSVPIMIQYYSRNKLPIKGAEHMRLLHPVFDQVL